MYKFIVMFLFFLRFFRFADSYPYTDILIVQDVVGEIENGDAVDNEGYSYKFV